MTLGLLCRQSFGRDNEVTPSRVTAAALGGSFRLTNDGDGELNLSNEETIIKLRRAIYDNIQRGGELLVDRDRVIYAANSPMPSFTSIADEVLKWFVRRAIPRTQPVVFSRPAGQPIDYQAQQRVDLELLTICCTNYDEDVRFVLEFCQSKGWLSYGGMQVSVKPQAFVYLEGEARDVGLSRRAFVAMWFDPRIQDAFDHGIEPAVRDAGYEPFRIDRHEHVNRIDDEILASIRLSKFIIADFSSEPGRPRGGVYFEAGFALGLEKPVIWTAREDLAAEIHFDTRQYNHIFWRDPTDLRQKIYNRIVSLIGLGPGALATQP